jgi:hypothetical protein
MFRGARKRRNFEKKNFPREQRNLRWRNGCVNNTITLQCKVSTVAGADQLDAGVPPLLRVDQGSSPLEPELKTYRRTLALLVRANSLHCTSLMHI